jgi:hypothetical protein
MGNFPLTLRARYLVLLAAVAVALCGCESKQEKALDQAKKQAAQTGKPQQVVYVDKTGATTTTVVQPPAPGQTSEAITTTTTQPASGQPQPPASEPVVSALPPPPPPPPPPPVNITIPAGTNLAIRIDQNISVKTSQAGDRFTGEVVSPVTASDGSEVIPKGSSVRGEVVESHSGGHFKGGSVLELKLTSVTVNGTKYKVATSDLERTQKGKGKRSAGLIGGGSGLGLLIGGLAGGGKGALIGGLVGGGAGTAAAGATGNKTLDIPAESVVNFTLASDLTIQESN